MKDNNNNFEDNKDAFGSKEHSDQDSLLKEQSTGAFDSLDPNNSDSSAKPPKKKRRKFSVIDKLLLFLAIGLFIAAAVLFLWEPVVNLMRTNKVDSVVNNIQNGEQTLIVNRNDMAINGEDYENLYEDPNVEPTMSAVDLPDDVVLTALGTIRIDKISLFIPLWDDAGIVPLRFGAGMLSGTALPGEEGNCVVLGHRMKKFGSLFNRLGEVKVGDEVLITLVNKTKLTYVVDEIIPSLDPAELYKYIDISSGSGKQLTLVTCTPTGIGSHRIIIIAHLKE